MNLPAAKSQTFAFLTVKAAKDFEKFANANFLEEDSPKSLRLSAFAVENIFSS